MASRQLISYDDITLPYEHQEQTPISSHSAHPTAAKKRKKNNQKTWSGSAFQKTASSGPTSAQNAGNGSSRINGSLESYAPADAMNEGEEEEEEEDRELSHEEIWDDSALVNAWEAAQQEYEMFHGKDKDWKNEPVKKSRLWYNIPVDPSVKKTPEVASQVPAADIPATSVESIDEEETDSRPLNFETFVPTYDPSLPAPPVMTQDYVSDVPAGAMVSQDEAFAKALNAMYWGGYWTAMYHSSRQNFQPRTLQNDAADLEDEELLADEEDGKEQGDNDGFISTQR